MAIEQAKKTVPYRLTDGFARTNAVVYISTEASDPGAAAIEDVTFAPLNAAPFAGGDGTDSARATFTAFTNGAAGAPNPQRQGLNSALLRRWLAAGTRTPDMARKSVRGQGRVLTS